MSIVCPNRKALEKDNDRFGAALEKRVAGKCRGSFFFYLGR